MTQVHYFLFIVVLIFLNCQNNQQTKEKQMDTLQKEAKDIPYFDYIHYEVGNPNFRGQTKININHSGELSLKFKKGQENMSFKHHLSHQEMEQLIVLLQTNNPCDLSSSDTPGQPGAAKIHLIFSKNKQLCSSNIWYNEQWKNPILRNLVVFFNNIANQVSEGKVKY